MRRILCTGSLGFLGANLVRALLDNGDFVIGIDDLSGGDEANHPTGIVTRDYYKFYEIDLANYKATDEVFRSHKPEIVVHLAANARESASFFDPYKICRANSLISSVVLELGVKYGMKKFVFTSSMSVFGKQRTPFAEEMRPRPVDPYGAQKAATEEMIAMVAGAHESFQYTILRPHNLFGPYQSMRDPFRNAIAIFANKIMRGEPINIYGKDHKRAFSFIGDALPAFVKATELDVANEQIINLGGTKEITILEAANEVVANFPEYPKPEIRGLPPRYGEVETAFATFDKSQKLLGFTETHGWKEGIRISCDWFRKKGPQEWMKDTLAIPTERIPLSWREHMDAVTRGRYD